MTSPNEDLFLENGSDGSAVAPAWDGNTKSQTSAQKRDNGKKHWFITLHIDETWNIGSDGSNLKHWIIMHCKEAVWQGERGTKTQKLHIQLQLTLKTKNRFSWLKNHMSQTARCEVTRNLDRAFDYCAKSETRVFGPFYYPEPIQKGVVDPLYNLDYYPWQKEIIDIITQPVNPRTIYWYWEPVGNIGKSDFCLHLILKHEAVVYDGCKKDILFAHKGQKIVLFDFDRDKEGKISYSAMESLKKGFCFSGKYESSMKVYQKPHMIVFANWPPDTSKLSQDRWCVTELGALRPLAPSQENPPLGEKEREERED